MMGCSIDADPNVTEARTEVGLVRGHAYSITKVVKAQIETPQASGEIPLIRIRNPWGNEAEWNGAWSDRYVGNFVIGGKITREFLIGGNAESCMFLW